MSIAMHHRRLRRSRLEDERRSVGSRAHRLGLTAFFVSIAINAVLGIYAVLAPGLGFGDTQGKVLGTSLCVTGAMLLALPASRRGSDASSSRYRSRPSS